MSIVTQLLDGMSRFPGRAVSQLFKLVKAGR